MGLNYRDSQKLNGCISDAKKIEKLLKYESDGEKNFDVRLITDENNQITTRTLKKEIENLFKENSDNMDTILFYFSGHGYLNQYGGYIVTSDSKTYDEGVPMSYIMTVLTHSKAKNKVIILDCCYSGNFGSKPNELDNKEELPHGVTILTASKAGELSYEDKNGGIFTELLCFALEGEAKNIFGEVTAAQIYSYIDSSLGSFDQRPLFKTNISKSVVLRKVESAISKKDLRRLNEFFEEIDSKYKLDPEHEPNINKDVKLDEFPNIPKDIKPDLKKVEKFELLQRLNREGLVKPEKEKHMFYAAMKSDSCILTPIGRHYWRLCVNDRI